MDESHGKNTPLAQLQNLKMVKTGKIETLTYNIRHCLLSLTCTDSLKTKENG